MEHSPLTLFLTRSLVFTDIVEPLPPSGPEEKKYRVKTRVKVYLSRDTTKLCASIMYTHKGCWGTFVSVFFFLSSVYGPTLEFFSPKPRGRVFFSFSGNLMVKSGTLYTIIIIHTYILSL